MSYPCPKCGGTAQRGSSSTAQHAAGLVGALIYAAFAPFSCVKCGKLARGDFSEEHQAQMTRNSVLMGVGGLAVLAAALAALVAINS